MAEKPPDELFVLMWENPWEVVIAHKIDDWGEKSEPPKFWVRYGLRDWGIIEDKRGGQSGSMDSETSG